VILLPKWAWAREPAAISLWASVLARGELNPAGEFIPWSEEHWQHKRRELSQVSPMADFPFPGAIALDHAFWRREEARWAWMRERLTALIAVEPSWRNYDRRARDYRNEETYAAAVRDELEAARRSSPRYWSRHSKESNGWRLALGLDREAGRADYEAGLRWCQERESAGVAHSKPVKPLLLHRLTRHADAIGLLRRSFAKRSVRRTGSVLMSPWCIAAWDDEKSLLEDLVMALVLHQTGAKTETQEWLGRARRLKKPDDDFRHLLQEAEALFAGQPTASRPKHWSRHLDTSRWRRQRPGACPLELHAGF
jgi:hypothetical protein